MHGGNRKIDFVFDAVRRETDWNKKIIDRLKLWKDFYDNYVPGDSGFNTIPQLVFICEDNMHMAEIFKIIIMNKLTIDKITFYYTTDLAQNEDNLSKSLFDFIQEGEKYKLRNVEAKILG